MRYIGFTPRPVEPHEERLENVQIERDRYRIALERIAREQSGVWGTIANEALHGRHVPPSEVEVPA
jgi:hypothetical protein